MGVGQPGSHLLKLFGHHVRQGLGHIPSQVGSSLTQKRGWRDVDVRLILPDDEYAALFSDPLTPAHQAGKVAMWDWAWSEAGRRLTDLPIDFQIQQRTLANANFEGPRSALQFVSSDEFRIAASEVSRAR